MYDHLFRFARKAPTDSMLAGEHVEMKREIEGGDGERRRRI